MNKNEPDHEFTERDTRKWQSQKKRTKRERPQLTIQQRITFLELLSQMASSTVFERKLGLSSNDIQYYKKILNIESQEEARLLLRKIKREDADKREVNILEQTAKAREAEEIANKRLQELQDKKATKTIEPKSRPNITEVRKDDAVRQRRHEELQNMPPSPAKNVSPSKRHKIIKSRNEWRLPIDDHDSIDRFKRDIKNHGFSFIEKKYGATSSQVKAEAKRLGLQINWDIVRR